MKKIIFTIILCNLLCRLSAQQNQGVVSYKIINIDTINNTIQVQDSIYSNFMFKPNKTKWEVGFVNHPIVTKTILNGEDYYLIMDQADSKTASHGELPNQNSFNQLLNYKDTSLLITKTSQTKTIAGRTCKKLILKYKILNSHTTVIWYDDTINCDAIIPGAGNKGKSIKGLIMEYEMRTPIGKSIITANSVSFENVANAQFIPNLTGYEVTELERENGSHNCNGHH